MSLRAAIAIKYLTQIWVHSDQNVPFPPEIEVGTAQSLQLSCKVQNLCCFKKNI